MLKFFVVTLFISLSLSSVEARETMPVVVVQGGFRSCREIQPTDKLPIGTKQADVFRDLKDRVEKELGAPLHWVLGCMGGGPFSDDAPMEFVSSSDMGSIGKAVFKTPHEDSLQGLRDRIEAEIAAAHTDSVYLIGSSYGGWSAMKLALKLLDKYKVEGLVTIDPISPLSCTPSVFLSLLPNKGCQHAPADISAGDRERHNSGIVSWSHFYQTQFERLHSSAYTEPRFVKRLDFDVSGFFYNDPHALIGRDPRIWKSIADHLIEFGKR